MVHVFKIKWLILISYILLTKNEGKKVCLGRFCASSKSTRKVCMKLASFNKLCFGQAKRWDLGALSIKHAKCAFNNSEHPNSAFLFILTLTLPPQWENPSLTSVCRDSERNKIKVNKLFKHNLTYSYILKWRTLWECI